MPSASYTRTRRSRTHSRMERSKRSSLLQGSTEGSGSPRCCSRERSPQTDGDQARVDTADATITATKATLDDILLSPTEEKRQALITEEVKNSGRLEIKGDPNALRRKGGHTG